MRRPCIVLLCLLALGCVTTSETRQTSPAKPVTPVAAVGLEVVAPTGHQANDELEESFFFVHCFDDRAWILLDGDEHLLVEEAALQFPGTDITLMAGAADGFVIAETLSAKAGSQATRVLGKGPQYRVYNGPDAVTVATAGTPQMVGRVVPHFGVVQEWSKQGIDPATENGTPARRDLRNIAAMHLMAPLEVPCTDQAFYWASPEEHRVRSAQSFREVSASAEERWAEKTRQLPYWTAGAARVRAAYEEQGESLPPPDLQVLECSGSLPLPPFQSGCFHVQLRLGTTMCGMGPDEAMFSILWPGDDSLPGLMEEHLSSITPLLIGDFDGDGQSEMVARTDSLSDTVELLRIEGAGLVSVKSTSITYADCPC